MNLPKVSIIVVVYNAKEAFSATLRNLLAVCYADKEIIVVDGGSTDGTRQVIEAHALEIANWVSQPDKGIYDAMNKGLSMATGEYVWFINAGDFVYDPYILEKIFKGEEVFHDFYYGDTLVLGENGKVKGLWRKRLPRRLTWHSFRRGMVVCHQSVIVRRSIAPDFNLRYKYSADVEWVLLALKAAKSICNVRSVVSVFVEGGATTRHRRESLKERYDIMRTYFGGSMTLLAHVGFLLAVLFPKYRKFKGDYTPFGQEN